MFNFYKLTRFLPGFLLLVLFLGLQGCAYAPQMDKLSVDTLGVASQTEIESVPFFPQSKYQCGPAALATVFAYRQLDVLTDDLVGQVYVPNRQGSFQVEMVAATRQQGLIPYPLAPKMKDMLTEVNAGNPVLVLQNLAFDSYPQWHFAVVVGYDLEKSEVVLRSGTTKRWVTSLRNFEQTWRKSNYWGIVIVLPDQLPATGTMEKWLSSAHDLEKLQYYKSVEKAYQAAIKKWPQHEEAWLALTNFEYGQKQYAKALNTFHRGLPKFMDSSRMWNNYAYVLKANQCFSAAKEAAACALKLTPMDKNVISTYKEMESLPVNGKVCEKVACNQ